MWVKIPMLFVLAIAAIQDCKNYRISNAWVVVCYGVGMITATLSGGLVGLIHAILRSLLPILVFYILYYIRALGAADLKIFGSAVLVCSAEEMKDLFIYSFAIGAAIAMVRLIHNGQLIVRLSNLKNYARQCLQDGSMDAYETFEDESSYLHFSVSILLAFCVITLREVFLSKF